MRSATWRIRYKYSVNKYKYWKPGKLVADEGNVERLVCSFLISSSMETART